MFHGSIVALVTPFKDGALDEQKLQELVEFQIDGGTSCLVARFIHPTSLHLVTLKQRQKYAIWPMRLVHGSCYYSVVS